MTKQQPTRIEERMEQYTEDLNKRLELLADNKNAVVFEYHGVPIEALTRRALYGMLIELHETWGRWGR